MATIEEQLAATLAMLQKQLAVTEDYKNSINTAVTIPTIVTRPNTDIYYLYSENGIINANTSNGGLVFPTGTTAERPAQPISGTVRYNKTTSALEIFSNQWQDVGTGVGGGSGGGGAPAGSANSGLFFQNSNTINLSFTTSNGTNYMSIGPLTHANGVITVTDGSLWKVI